jgi:AcrR family transcriptional regulator
MPVADPAGGPEGEIARWEGRSLDRSLAAARGRSTRRARGLVDAARLLAARSGSSTWTVADVAAEAGVSLRSFYRHFSGRDELLLALFEEEARTGAQLMTARLADIDQPLERLRAFVEGLAGLVITGSGYSSLLVQEHLRLGEAHPAELRAALAPLVERLDAELAAAADAGQIRAVDEVDAATVFALLITNAQTVALLAPQADPALTVARLWEFCRRALSIDPSPRRERR